MNTRNQFMKFFREDEKLNTLSPEDRIEIFLGILPGRSDITKELLDELFSDYSVSPFKEFPNGFDMWQETHFEMVVFICSSLFDPLEQEFKSDPIIRFRDKHGHSEVMLLAKQMTDAFEEKFQGYVWDDDWQEALEAFQIDYIKNNLPI